MSADEKYEYGPLRTYQITWKSGHIEEVQGHQVMISGGDDLFGQSTRRPVRFTIHGMFPGDDWRFVISGLEDDVICIRDVTEPEFPTTEDATGTPKDGES
jgi:hypothetical protein